MNKYVKSNDKGWNWRKTINLQKIKKNSNQKNEYQIWYKFKWNQIIRDKIKKINF